MEVVEGVYDGVFGSEKQYIIKLKVPTDRGVGEVKIFCDQRVSTQLEKLFKVTQFSSASNRALAERLASKKKISISFQRGI